MGYPSGIPGSQSVYSAVLALNSRRHLSWLASARRWWMALLIPLNFKIEEPECCNVMRTCASDYFCGTSTPRCAPQERREGNDSKGATGVQHHARSSNIKSVVGNHEALDSLRNAADC